MAWDPVCGGQRLGRQPQTTQVPLPACGICRATDSKTFALPPTFVHHPLSFRFPDIPGIFRELAPNRKHSLGFWFILAPRVG
jgi:hypothetical protein